MIGSGIDEDCDGTSVCYADGDDVFTMPELFDRLSKAAFDGLEQGNVSASSKQSALAAAKRRSNTSAIIR